MEPAESHLMLLAIAYLWERRTGGKDSDFHGYRGDRYVLRSTQLNPLANYSGHMHILEMEEGLGQTRDYPLALQAGFQVPSKDSLLEGRLEALVISPHSKQRLPRIERHETVTLERGKRVGVER
jgi:hypothetical protein